MIMVAASTAGIIIYYRNPTGTNPTNPLAYGTAARLPGREGKIRFVGASGHVQAGSCKIVAPTGTFACLLLGVSDGIVSERREPHDRCKTTTTYKKGLQS
jgi:hypothetical protein